MGVFRIRGGIPLFGKVKVSGSKNAALPVLFASIATCGVSEIDNLPDISDVRCAIKILEHLGAAVERRGTKTYVNTSELAYSRIPDELVRPLRASTYLLSSMLLRFGVSELGEFGGCNFAPRPIDIHLASIASHGASVDGCTLHANRLVPSDFKLAKRSVGATVNSLIISSGIKGVSVIRGCALEPHIHTLIEYLNSAGARISLSGDVATVEGGELSGGRICIGGDMIEAGSFLAASAMSRGSVSVLGARERELSSFVDPFIKSGMTYSGGAAVSLSGIPRKKVDIITAPYPGFPTDLQPIAAPLLAFSGGSITDTVWCGRLGYLSELSKMGIRSRIVGGVAEIFPSEPRCAEVTAPDLRGGMALMIAALAADGESVIHSGELLSRGYERLLEKLTQLGAEIEYEK